MSDYGSYHCSSGAPDYVKDPDATVDYAFNWAGYLDGDTISTSDFILPDGLTAVSASNNTTSAAIFVSGGEAGRMYRITNRIVTAGGRTFDRTLRVLVQEQ